jgi:FimV-like protein
MHFLRLFAVLLAVNFMTATMATADTTAKLRGPKEFDAPQQTRIGPLTPADTLWRLAEQSRPDRRINMYQMMYALYQKNPDAFLEENFNHLKPGAFLQIPSVREILAVDALEAQRKSENDDRIWAERVRRVELAKAEAAAAKQLDIVTAKEQLSEELSRVEAQQTEQISDLRNRIGASMANVETIVQENTELKQQLNTVVQELGAVKNQLDKDSEIQTQLQQLLAQQNELLEQQREQMRKAEEGFNFAATMQEIASSPVGWAIAGSLPAIVLLYFIVSMIRRRGQKAAAVVTAATAAPATDPNYRSPLPPLDDSLDFDESSLINLDDSLLNDNMGAGIRLDNDAFSPPAKASPNASFADDLLDDHFMLPTDDKSGGDFDLDSLLDEPAVGEKTTAKTEFDPNNILSGDDLSSLFNTLEEDEPDFTAKAEFDPNNILSNNELSSLFDNLADEDPDDIFNQAQAAQDAKAAVRLDDAESPLAEKVVSAEALQNAAAEADQFDELLEEIELDIPGDEDSSLLETSDDEFDIDALLASTQQTDSKQVAESSASSIQAVEDDFDIDSLLAANIQPDEPIAIAAEPSSPDVTAQFDSSELDAFAESLAEEVLPGPDQSSDQVQPEEDDENITELLEPDTTELYNELEDILTEVAELRAQSQQQSSALAELTLPASALDEAAADFADAELSAADVSAMLQDDTQDDTDVAADAAFTEQVSDFTATTTAEVVDDAEDIIDIAELLEEQDMPSLAVAQDIQDRADDDFSPAANIVAEHAQAEPTTASAMSTAQSSAMLDEDIPPTAELLANSVGNDILLDSLSDFDVDIDNAANATLMPDLQLGDDQSVSRLSEGSASVERPSKMLESYPELDFTEDMSDESLIYPDEMTASEPDPFADFAPALVPDADFPDELAALEDIQFDQLLSELDELELPSSSQTTVPVSVAQSTDLNELSLLAEFAVDPVPSSEASSSSTEEGLDFLQIDKLLASTEDESTDEQLQPLQIDVGLADFPDLISPDEVGDVDLADAGFAGRLDLVRAYNEIGDADSAEQVVKEILASDAPDYVKQEALSLLSS